MIEQHRRLKVIEAPFGWLPLSFEFFFVNLGRLILLLLTAFALVAEAATLDVGRISSAADQSHSIPENDGTELAEMLKCMLDTSQIENGDGLFMQRWLSSPSFDQLSVSKCVIADLKSKRLAATPPYRWFCVDQR
jgi:hypothetical protein